MISRPARWGSLGRLRRAAVTSLQALFGRTTVDGARRMRTVVQEAGRRWAVGRTVRRVRAGHSSPDTARSVVLCVVKDGAEWTPTFIEHHLRLGFDHIVLLDNGSTDGTPDLARPHPAVTLLTSRFGSVASLREYLLDRYAVGRWALSTDIDMLFDYPLSDLAPVPALVRYLDDHGYTALATYLLDMFPEGALEDAPAGRFVDTHRYCDLSEVSTLPYPDHLECVVDNPAITRRVGGIRKTVFGLDVELINHPLVRYRSGMFFGNPHYFKKARVADVAGVMYHYKFTAAFRRLAREESAGSRFGIGPENHRYLAVLDASPRLTLRRATAIRLAGTRELVDRGFLPCPERFVVAARAGSKAGTAPAPPPAPSASWPFVSVVVPTWNRAPLLAGCLASLRGQDYPPDRFEIVVVDDGSVDDTAGVVQKCVDGGLPVVRYQRGDHRGLNVARNLGLTVARGDPVCFVDDDVESPTGWLHALVDGALRHPEAGCVGGAVKLRFEAPPPRICSMESWEGESSLDHGAEERPVDHVNGCNLAVRRWALDRVGRFNETLSGAGDETEWERRLTRAGIPILYLPSAWLWHRRTAADLGRARLFRRRFRQGRDYVAFARIAGERISVAHVLWPIPFYLAHAARRRCFGAVLEVARKLGIVWGATRG